MGSIKQIGSTFILGLFLSLDLVAGGNDRDAIVIPVVFHIIHMDDNENISNAQIADALRILNEDFNRENPDWTTVRPEFIDLVADVGIEFRLARRDPEGNCTNGVTRARSASTYLGNEVTRGLVQWPPDKYLNVWVTASIDTVLAAVATSPASADLDPAQDGIVIRNTYLGSIGTGSNSPINRTLTRAVGTWLGLLNTWGTGPVGSPTNCDQDDGIADTPNTIGHDQCDLDAATCGSPLDNVENFMEASYCQKMFTEGQKARMLETLNSSIAQRDQLWTAENLVATGVFEEPVLCSVEFSPAIQSICRGGNVVFTDLSSGPVAQRIWQFPGGTPNTSTDSIVTGIYEQPGTYDVTLTVSDGTTQLSTTEQAVVKVSPLPGMAVPIEEGFESADPLSDLDWTVIDHLVSTGFQVTNVAAFSGSKSLVVQNGAGMMGEWAELISPPIDLSGESSTRIAYRYAFAQRDAGNNDKLLVYISQNCGTNWFLLQELYGNADLNTGGIVVDPFIPQPTQWAYTEITDIPFSYLQEDFRVKFQFQGDGGNSFYLDDININGSPVGMPEQVERDAWMNVAPNPATEYAQVEVDLEELQHIQLQLFDLTGKLIGTIYEGNCRVGPDRFDLPIADLKSGIYSIRCVTGKASQSLRLIVM